MPTYDPTGLVLVPAVTQPPSQSSVFFGMDPASMAAAVTSLQNALINLNSGTQVAMVAYGTGSGAKSVTYSRGDRNEIRNTIRELQILLGIAPRRRALSVAF